MSELEKVKKFLNANPDKFELLSIKTVLSMKKDMGIVSPNTDNTKNPEEKLVKTQREKDEAVIEFMRQAYKKYETEGGRVVMPEKLPSIDEKNEVLFIHYINIGNKFAKQALLCFYLAGETFIILRNKFELKKKHNKALDFDEFINTNLGVSKSTAYSYGRLYEAYQPYRKFLTVADVSKDSLLKFADQIKTVLERGYFDDEEYDFEAEPFLDKSFWQLSTDEWKKTVGKNVPKYPAKRINTTTKKMSESVVNSPNVASSSKLPWDDAPSPSLDDLDVKLRKMETKMASIKGEEGTLMPSPVKERVYDDDVSMGSLGSTLEATKLN